MHTPQGWLFWRSNLFPTQLVPQELHETPGRNPTPAQQPGHQGVGEGKAFHASRKHL